jgi:manganese-dependent inorganic pyrophosphatase
LLPVPRELRRLASARRRNRRHNAKEYELGTGVTISIVQLETVGDSVQERCDELLDALGAFREREGHVLSALMLTDSLANGTDLLVSGERRAP